MSCSACSAGNCFVDEEEAVVARVVLGGGLSKVWRRRVCRGARGWARMGRGGSSRRRER